MGSSLIPPFSLSARRWETSSPLGGLVAGVGASLGSRLGLESCSVLVPGEKYEGPNPVWSKVFLLTQPPRALIVDY